MTWKSIWGFLLGLIFLYLQLLVLPAFELLTVIPNILIPWLVYLVWTRDQKAVLIPGFVIGLMYDTTQPEALGAHALIFTLIALACDRFRQPFEEESVVARMLTLLLAGLIFHVSQFIVLGAIYSFDNDLLKLSAIGLGYDLVFSFVVFWTLQFLSRLRIVAVHD